MAYCAQADIIKMLSSAELAELTAESGSTPDADVVSEAIAHADAEIDSYLSVRYVLPFAATPPRVKTLSVAMALYYLFSRRPTLGLPETVRKNYEDAIAFLKEVARGNAQIPDAAGAELTGDSEHVTEISSSTRVFSRDNLGDW